MKINNIEFMESYEGDTKIWFKELRKRLKELDEFLTYDENIIIDFYNCDLDVDFFKCFLIKIAEMNLSSKVYINGVREDIREKAYAKIVDGDYYNATDLRR